MTALIVLALLLALYVLSVGWILRVPFRSPKPPSHRQTAPKRKASTRLMIAVLLFAAGAAVLLVIAISWIASFLRHALS